VLWLSIVAVRSGAPNPIAATAVPIDPKNWPGQIVRLFEGELREDVVTAWAGSLDLISDNHRLCEAKFYVGTSQIMHHHEDVARPLLQDAAATCPRSFIESRAAKEELAGAAKFPAE